MDYYSSSNQSSPYGRSDAYSRASRYRAQPSAVTPQATSFDVFGADYGDLFGRGRGGEMIFESAAKKAEDNLSAIEHQHKLKMQKLTQDTQRTTYGIAKRKADEARKKAEDQAKRQQRKGFWSSAGSIVGGGLGLLTGNPAGFAFGAQIGGFLGDQLG